MPTDKDRVEKAVNAVAKTGSEGCLLFIAWLLPHLEKRELLGLRRIVDNAIDKKGGQGE